MEYEGECNHLSTNAIPHIFTSLLKTTSSWTYRLPDQAPSRFHSERTKTAKQKLLSVDALETPPSKLKSIQVFRVRLVGRSSSRPHVSVLLVTCCRSLCRSIAGTYTISKRRLRFHRTSPTDDVTLTRCYRQ